MNAFTASRGEVRAVSDDEILDAYSLLGAREGSLLRAVPRRRRSPACSGTARRARGLRAHRPWPQGPAPRVNQAHRSCPASPTRRPRGGRARMNRRRLVRAPASSANLGPGYDVLAAALSPCSSSRWRRPASSRSSATSRACRSTAPTCACARSSGCTPSDGLRFRIRSEIPASAGLGSSAAAIVAGLAAADHLYELDAPLFEHAVALEGHPDNVAAAVYGGLRVCCGTVDPARSSRRPSSRAVIAVPRPDEGADLEARAALPSGRCRWRMAVHNVGHAAEMLVCSAWLAATCRSSRAASRMPSTSRTGTTSIRAPWSSSSSAGRRGAVGASISGAGPTVLVWCRWEQTGQVMERLRAEAPGFDLRRVTFAPAGVDVREL